MTSSIVAWHSWLEFSRMLRMNRIHSLNWRIHKCGVDQSRSMTIRVLGIDSGVIRGWISFGNASAGVDSM